jgi:putative heme-binding domain-containing protein
MACHKDPRVRQCFLRTVKEIASSIANTTEAETRIIQDPDVGVRREALLWLRDADAHEAESLILSLAEKYDGKDRFYLEAIGIAVGHHDQKRREIILADFEKHFPEWNEKVANLIWELRPPTVMPKLGKRLADTSLPLEQRLQIVDILAGTPDTSGGQALIKTLSLEMPSEVRDRILAKLMQFLPGKWRALRQSKETGEAIDALMAKPELRLPGLALLGAAGREDAIGRIVVIARDDKEPMAFRSAAMHALGAMTGPAATKALESLSAVQPITLRVHLAKALGEQLDIYAPGNRPAMKALERLVLAKDQEVTVRQAAVEALTSTYNGTGWLIEVSERKGLPDDLRADAGRLLRNSPFGDQRQRARAVFPVAKLDLKKLPEISHLARRRGDAAHGKQLLAASLKADTQCLKCHTIRGVGGQIGPDLSVIGQKASRENLFESILYPSKAIADQFVTWNVVTKDGKSISGLIVEETPDHVTLRDANGRDSKVSKKDIEAREKDPKSLMPDNLLAYMSEDELVDLVEYLFNLKVPALTMDYWHIIGPFDNGANDEGLDHTYPPEKGIDLKAEYRGKLGTVGWKSVKPDGTGYVDLAAHYGKDSDNIVSYLYREIESPVDQEATVLIGTDDAARLWINERQVFEERRHDAAVPEKHAVKMKLKKGRNRLLLKINNGDGPHGFYFTILADKELKRVENR